MNTFKLIYIYRKYDKEFSIEVVHSNKNIFKKIFCQFAYFYASRNLLLKKGMSALA